MRESVCDIFLKDDNTRISAAKKDGVGNEQKRFLLHPMKILHTKYQCESNKNRPTNIVCKVCDHFSYQIEKLHREGNYITEIGRSYVLTCIIIVNIFIVLLTARHLNTLITPCFTSWETFNKSFA